MELLKPKSQAISEIAGLPLFFFRVRNRNS